MLSSFLHSVMCAEYLVECPNRGLVVMVANPLSLPLLLMGDPNATHGQVISSNGVPLCVLIDGIPSCSG